MQRKGLYTILSVIVFIGLLSVLGAFFVEHNIHDGCLFSPATNCASFSGIIGEALHHLNSASTYFSGIAVTPLILLALVAAVIVSLNTDIIAGVSLRRFFISRLLETRYIPAREATSYTFCFSWVE